MGTNWTREAMAVARFVQGRQEAMPPCEVDLTPTDREQDVRDDLLEVLTESVAQVAGLYLDPECRFLRHPGHTCHGRDGEPLRPHAACWVEASAQMQEQGHVLHLAERSL